MPIFKSSVSIEQSPEAVFDYVSDIRNVAQFYDGVSAVEPGEGGAVRVTTRRDGHPLVKDGWFRVHEGHRKRVEWGTEDDDGYHGWLEVDPEGEVCSVTVEVHLDAPADGAADDVDRRLDAILFALKAGRSGGKAVSPLVRGSSS